MEDVNKLRWSFLSLSLSLKKDIVVGNSAPGEFACIWQFKRVEVIAIEI